MCISASPSEMSKTHLYAGEAVFRGKYVHVLAYQNRASSKGPNAMILPIPAFGSLGRENVIDTRAFPDFLEDIGNATKRVYRGGFGSRSAEYSADVFQVGSYTVVLAAGSAGVHQALQQVPDDWRPAVGAGLLASFDQNYPGWHLAVCCWSGDVQAEPLLWWFDPMYPAVLFAPALDAHDGEAPDLGRDVGVDHVVSFGTNRTHGAAEHDERRVRYRKLPTGPAADLLPTRVAGTKVTGKLPNGDFFRPVGSAGPMERRLAHSERGMTLPLNGWS